MHFGGEEISTILVPPTSADFNIPPNNKKPNMKQTFDYYFFFFYFSKMCTRKGRV
jgi:hypothetical protein